MLLLDIFLQYFSCQITPKNLLNPRRCLILFFELLLYCSPQQFIIIQKSLLIILHKTLYIINSRWFSSYLLSSFRLTFCILCRKYYLAVQAIFWKRNQFVWFEFLLFFLFSLFCLLFIRHNFRFAFALLRSLFLYSRIQKFDYIFNRFYFLRLQRIYIRIYCIYWWVIIYCWIEVNLTRTLS